MVRGVIASLVAALFVASSGPALAAEVPAPIPVPLDRRQTKPPPDRGDLNKQSKETAPGRKTKKKRGKTNAPVKARTGPERVAARSNGWPGHLD